MTTTSQPPTPQVIPPDPKWPVITAAWVSAVAGLTGVGVTLANSADGRTWLIIGMALAGLCTLSGLIVLVPVSRDSMSFRVIVLAAVGLLIGTAAFTSLAMRSASAQQHSPTAMPWVTLDQPTAVTTGTGFTLTGTLSGELPPGTVLWPAVQPDSDRSGFYAQGRNCGTPSTDRRFTCDYILLNQPGDWHIVLVLASPNDISEYIAIRVNISDCMARLPTCQPGKDFLLHLKGQPIDGGAIVVRAL